MFYTMVAAIRGVGSPDDDIILGGSLGAVGFSVEMPCHLPRQARTKGLIEVN